MYLHTIKAKVNLSVVLVGLTLVVIVLFSAFVISQMKEYNQDITSYRDHQKEARLTYNLQINVTNLWQFFTDASLTKDPAVVDKEAKPVFEEAQKILGVLMELNRHDAEHTKKLSAIKDDLGKVWETGSRMFAAYQSDWNKGNVVMDEYDKICDKLIKEVGTYVEIENKNSDKAVDEMFEMSARSILITKIVVALILAISCCMFAFMIILRRSILPLKGLTENVALIASGDLRVEVAATGKDEVGLLAGSVNQMAGTLNEMINRTLASVSAVTSGVQRLEVNAGLTAEGSRNQSQQAAMIATASEEFSQTIHDIARNSSQASSTSAQARKTACHGRDVAEKATQIVTSVSSSTERLATTVNNLNDRAEDIAKILEVITDIADQTNLLALNASIEAARAGEQGRGFAVVADEVRLLADRTKKATNEIAGTVHAIESELKSTGSSMSDASNSVLSATECIAEVQQSLSRIVDSVMAVETQIIQIATAVEEQSATAESISQNIEATSSIAARVDDMSAEVLIIVEELLASTTTLREATSGFKTRSMVG